LLTSWTLILCLIELFVVVAMVIVMKMATPPTNKGDLMYWFSVWMKFWSFGGYILSSYWICTWYEVYLVTYIVVLKNEVKKYSDARITHGRRPTKQ
jgi:hypothetical protein